MIVITKVNNYNNGGKGLQNNFINHQKGATLNKIDPSEAFKLYQLTKFYPLCILSNFVSIMAPGLVILFLLSRTFTIRIERKNKRLALTESELLSLLEKLQEKREV